MNQTASPTMHATKATPNTARGESSPSAASAPATTSVGTAGIGRPSCSNSTFAKTSASPYSAISRFMRSRSVARKAPDHAPVALGGPAVSVVRRMRPGTAHCDHVLAPRPALLTLGIQQRRLGGRTAFERHRAHFDQPLQLARAQLELVARFDFLGRLHALAVELYLAALHRPRGEAARLVEARRPKPPVDAQAPGRTVWVARRRHGCNPSGRSSCSIPPAPASSARPPARS